MRGERGSAGWNAVAVVSVASGIVGLFVTLLFLPIGSSGVRWALSGGFACLVAMAIGYMWGTRVSHKKTALRVFESRDDMLAAWTCREIVLGSNHSLLVLGGTLRHFVNKGNLALLRSFIESRGGEVKILLANPSSQGLYLRARQEGNVDGLYSALHSSMASLMDFGDELSPGLSRSRFEVRKYNDLPTSSLFVAGDGVAYTFYQSNASASDSLWYVMRGNGQQLIRDRMSQHFFSIWERAEPIEEPDNYAILFAGMPAAGKTTVATALAERLDSSSLLSSHDIRIKAELMDVTSRQERAVMRDLLVGSIHQQLAMGHRRLVIDTNLAIPTHRGSLLSLLADQKVDAYWFDVICTHRDRVQRLAVKFETDPLYSRLKIGIPELERIVKGASQPLHALEQGSVSAIFRCDTSSRQLLCTCDLAVQGRFALVLVQRLEEAGLFKGKDSQASS